jgi:hypothetical protein
MSFSHCENALKVKTLCVEPFSGVAMVKSPRNGMLRAFAAKPFGNRIAILQAAGPSQPSYDGRDIPWPL